MTAKMEELVLVLEAAAFAAEKHRHQRRKDIEASPYINHPLSLARTLLVTGGVTSAFVLAAALLHDTLEDTETSEVELAERFGEKVAGIVREVTDDKRLPKEERKRLQIESSRHKSQEAKLVKIADKISNLRDILACPPADWSRARKLAYFEWAAAVVDGMRGTSVALEQEFDRVHGLGIEVFNEAAA